jgi:hypothetical protein
VKYEDIDPTYHHDNDYNDEVSSLGHKKKKRGFSKTFLILINNQISLNQIMKFYVDYCNPYNPYTAIFCLYFDYYCYRD